MQCIRVGFFKLFQQLNRRFGRAVFVRILDLLKVLVAFNQPRQGLLGLSVLNGMFFRERNQDFGDPS